ncbi:hypothetical protein N658DRAFT_62201 [Parathielavia hyrcaniae]|uniref:Uncharacterized protein n=1 Tax=Parathielavia hyrcaniae TaxID=113614 RepID=A0AAN6T1C3_9PEZI|nr:hypothetical protein N658DRAFT_62201 [Parathielavia hyrcaniae]
MRNCPMSLLRKRAICESPVRDSPCPAREWRPRPASRLRCGFAPPSSCLFCPWMLAAVTIRREERGLQVGPYSCFQ